MNGYNTEVTISILMLSVVLVVANGQGEIYKRQYRMKLSNYKQILREEELRPDTFREYAEVLENTVLKGTIYC